MEKGMCYAALGAAALFGLLFLLDMFAGFPFGGGSFITFDIFGLICAGIVGYLGFNAMKDLK
jgi:hypothetical protein